MRPARSPRCRIKMDCDAYPLSSATVSAASASQENSHPWRQAFSRQASVQTCGVSTRVLTAAIIAGHAGLIVRGSYGHHFFSHGPAQNQITQPDLQSARATPAGHKLHLRARGQTQGAQPGTDSIIARHLHHTDYATRRKVRKRPDILRTQLVALNSKNYRADP